MTDENRQDDLSVYYQFRKPTIGLGVGIVGQLGIRPSTFSLLIINYYMADNYFERLFEYSNTKFSLG